MEPIHLRGAAYRYEELKKVPSFTHNDRNSIRFSNESTYELAA